MAVRAMTGADEDWIWHKMPLAVGLQYHAQWWRRENEIRQLSAPAALAGIAEIFVLSASESEEKESERKMIV